MVSRGFVVRAVGVVSCLIFLAGLFIGGAQPVAVGLVAAPWDKLAHLVSFGVFTFLVELALRPPSWLLVALPLAASAADEFHQAFLPGRFVSAEDWLAGAVGTCIAFLLLRHTRIREWIAATER